MASEWIPRGYRRPQKNEAVLAVVEVEGAKTRMIVRRLPTVGYWAEPYGGLTDDQVLYWMPLPSLPEEATDADR